MGEESVVDGVTMVAEELDGALEVAAVPQHDGGDQQVEAAGAVVLVLVRAVADLAQAVEEDGAGERVACLALVEAVLRRRRSSGLRSQSRTKSVRSIRPTLRRPAASRLCRGKAASFLRMCEGATCPPAVEATSRRSSGQASATSSGLILRAISGFSVGQEPPAAGA